MFSESMVRSTNCTCSHSRVVRFLIEHYNNFVIHTVVENMFLVIRPVASVIRRHHHDTADVQGFRLTGATGMLPGCSHGIGCVGNTLNHLISLFYDFAVQACANTNQSAWYMHYVDCCRWIVPFKWNPLTAKVVPVSMKLTCYYVVIVKMLRPKLLHVDVFCSALVGSWVMWWPCLSVRTHISWTTYLNFTRLLCTLSMGMPRSCCYGVAIRCVLPALWVTLNESVIRYIFDSC